jgi:hypothetical protein
MADTKLSALALGVLAEATEIYLNATGSRRTTFTAARDFLLTAACRANCVAATTAAQVLADDFESGDVIDGVTLALADRVLIKNQTLGEENGIYTVNVAAPPTRATDFDTDAEAVLGALVAVSGGTANGTSVWMHSTTGAITLDTTPLTFAELLAASNFLQLADTPSNYTADSRKFLRVNDAENAVEFVAEHNKEPVKFATTAALTLADDFENGDPLDGGTLTTGDRILIKDQASGAENGLYTVQGSGGPVRVPDMDDDPDVVQGMTVAVLQGTANANSIFQLTTTGAITLDVTALTFVQISGGGGASDFLSLTDVDPSSYSGQSGKSVNVNTAEDGLEFLIPSPGGTVVGAPFSGAVVKNASNLAGNFQSAADAVTFDTETYDIGGWHSTSVNTERLTVPAGINKVRMTAAIRDVGASAEQWAFAEFRKNGSVAVGTSRSIVDVGANPAMTLASPVLDVVEGDYFELFYQIQTDTSSDLLAIGTHFSIEAVEAVAPSSKVIGPWLELDRQTAVASSEIDFTFDPALYDEIEVAISGLHSSSDSDTLDFLVSTNGGVSFLGGSNYRHVRAALSDGGGSGAEAYAGVTSDSTIQLSGSSSISNVATEVFSGTVTLHEPSAIVSKVVAWSLQAQTSADVAQQHEGTGHLISDTAAINAIRFILVTGNLTGQFILRGRPKAGVDFFHATPVNGVGQPFKGALVKMTADLAVNTQVTQLIAWEEIVYDLGGFWSSLTPSRLTVPAGVTKIRLNAAVYDSTGGASDFNLFQFHKNGALFTGSSTLRNHPDIGTHLLSIASPVVEVAEGDYFEAFYQQQSDTSSTINAVRSHFSVEVVEGIATSNTPRGAMVKPAADIIGANYTAQTAVPFDAEVYDTDSVHSTSVNNTRLTVPAGVTHARVHFNVRLNNIVEGQYTRVDIFKNGSGTFDGATTLRADNAGTGQGFSISTPVLEVVPGDYFEGFVLIETETTIDVTANQTSLSMEFINDALIVATTDPSAVGVPFKGALLQIDSDFTLVDVTTTTIDWGSATYDVGGWFSSGAVSRLTVPAGVTKVRVSSNLAMTAWGTGVRFIGFLQKNGADVRGGSFSDMTGDPNNQVAINLTSAVLNVVPGDYFEIRAFQDSAGNETLGPASRGEYNWFSIEAVEAIAPSTAIRGALATLVADDIGVNFVGAAAVVFDKDVYDTDSIHDTVSNNTRLTVPAGVTHIRLNFNVHLSNIITNEFTVISIRKNGSLDWDGVATQRSDANSSIAQLNAITGVVEVVPGDYFEAFIQIEAETTVDVNASRTNFGMEIVERTALVQAPATGNTFKGALVNLAADEVDTVNYTSPVAIAFDEEEYDIGGWHDDVTDNERLTVPAGVTKVRVNGQVLLITGVSGDFLQLEIRKNGSGVYIGSAFTKVEPNSTTQYGNVTTSVIDVVEGDYFELALTVESDTTITVRSDRTSLSIEAVETVAPSTNPRGALVTLAADEVDADYTTATAVPFDAEQYDTDTVHDNSTNNTRLTVPAGVRHIQLVGQVQASSVIADEWMQIDIRKNGSAAYIGFAQQMNEIGKTESGTQVVSPILEVIAGDYFELFLRVQTEATITLVDDQTWFAMEIVEPAVVTGNTGMQFIEKQEGSNQASMDFTGFNSTLYDSYLFVIANLVPATDNVNFQIRTSGDGGSTFDSGGSDYARNRAGRTDAAANDVWLTRGEATATGIAVTSNENIGSAANEDGLSGEFKIFGPHLAKRTIVAFDVHYFTSAGNLEIDIGNGMRDEAAAVDAAQFLFASGNIESGTITMYGLRNS